MIASQIPILSMTSSAAEIPTDTIPTKLPMVEMTDDAERRDSELPTCLSEAMDASAKLRNYFEQCKTFR